MPETLANYLSHRTPLELLRDVADIVVVYYLFYRLLLVARGTRAMQIATGLGIVCLLYVVAQAIGLVTIVALFGALLQSIILVIVVVFQTDIRRALERVGSRAFFGNFARAQESEVIESVVLAAGELARHRVGAIIAFEQDANLDEFIGQNKGITLDARVSRELLVSLFLPDGSNKLHDGAVILRNLRIAKAGVFFPMPESRVFDPSFGSRHRAAIGITEETDAVVVVVSEERGTISFCFNGNVASNLQAEQLREMLLSIMSPKVRRKSRQVQRRRSTSSVLPPEVEPRERGAGEDSLPPPPPSFGRRVSPSAAPPPLRKAPPSSASTQTPRAAGVDSTRRHEDDTEVDASLRQSVSSPTRPIPRGQGLELPLDPEEADEPRNSST
jgi:diadenylate cyclase